VGFFEFDWNLVKDLLVDWLEDLDVMQAWDIFFDLNLLVDAL